MKEGRKVIIPTQRQIESMTRKQAEANLMEDGGGRTGLEAKISDIKDIENYIKQLGLTKQQQKDILENGRATDEFVQINVLRILKAMRDGDKTNEMNDKKFKFNLENLIKKWANSEVEMMAAFDKDGKFLGYQTQAKTGTVQITTGAGQLAGGTTVHSHPEEDGRFFGGTFSVGDWTGFKEKGEKLMVVTSKEGTYMLERTGPLKFTNSDVNKAYVRMTVRTVLSKQRIKDDKLTKFGCSKSDLAVWRDLHNGTKELASQAGVKYTFIPNKGFEGIDK